jgi:uncharacterized RmlC-like cupin family protein
MAVRQAATGEANPMKSCKVIRGGESFLGKQGLNYFAGISAESANAEAICMHPLVMPPGASAKPHYHESHETAIYMLEGVTEFLHGANLEFKDRVEAGNYVYIPAGVPTNPITPPTNPPARSSPEPIPTNRKVWFCWVPDRPLPLLRRTCIAPHVKYSRGCWNRAWERKFPT